MQTNDPVLDSARSGDDAAFAQLVAPHRRELTAYCYRMSGSLHDAEDLLQESLLRAWRGLARFEGRSSVRTWLYRVATSACLDALDKRAARTLPTERGPAADARAPFPPPDTEALWLEPCPDDLADATPPSPEARVTSRESVALAFLVALQSLPPRQRSVLLLRDVVGLDASECAALLEMTVAAANSALQRARETLAARPREAQPHPGEGTLSALRRYVRAWEDADVGALVALLREDATLSMPPFPAWLAGPEAIGAALAAMVLPPEARGRFRFVETRANGRLAVAAYAKDDAGVFRANGLHVLAFDGARLTAIDAFLDPTLFPLFGLAPVLP